MIGYSTLQKMGQIIHNLSASGFFVRILKITVIFYGDLHKIKTLVFHCGTRVFAVKLLSGFEPLTSSLPRMRSTD